MYSEMLAFKEKNVKSTGLDPSNNLIFFFQDISMNNQETIAIVIFDHTYIKFSTVRLYTNYVSM